MTAPTVSLTHTTLVYPTAITSYVTDVQTSTDAYHNLANVRAGLGDICRLVGMTAGEIAGFADDAALYAREAALASAGIGGWLLPTKAEQLVFTGPIPSTLCPDRMFLYPADGRRYIYIPETPGLGLWPSGSHPNTPLPKLDIYDDWGNRQNRVKYANSEPKQLYLSGLYFNNDRRFTVVIVHSYRFGAGGDATR